MQKKLILLNILFLIGWLLKFSYFAKFSSIFAKCEIKILTKFSQFREIRNTNMDYSFDILQKGMIFQIDSKKFMKNYLLLGHIFH